MKIRTSFVGNSSSSSFAITNKTQSVKTFGDFLDEFDSFNYAIEQEYMEERIKELRKIKIKPKNTLQFSLNRNFISVDYDRNENFEINYLFGD